MEKQTAVEWLIDRIEDVDNTPEIWELIKIKAKEMEKQQIIDAYSESAISFMDGILNKDDCKEEAENYYTETYKQG